jgi:hypothetical protein
MGAWAWLRGRVTPAALGYIAAVTVLAAVGFAAGRPLLIGVAAIVTLPVSIVAVPAFYVLAGLLGLVPGANPSHASGSGSAGPHGKVVVTQTGEPASWYLVSLDVLGVAVFAAAAVAMMVLLDVVIRWRRRAHAGA